MTSFVAASGEARHSSKAYELLFFKKENVKKHGTIYDFNWPCRAA